LKTCVTALDDETLVINPRHLDVAPLRHLPWIEVDPREPFAANTLTLAGTVLASAAGPRTADRIRARGYAIRELDLSELAKAEAGLTCMSLIFP
jgi:dimethylargininase